MALFRRFFYRKPPDRLFEISERVYVFDCCFSMTVLDEDDYKEYLGGIVAQLQDYYPDASFMLCNFREGDRRTQISDILSQYDMTVIEYPQQYQNCSLLPLEMIYNFLRSSESWLSLERQQNVILMHCDRGGWPVLAFILASLLLYRKQYNGEQKTLEMVYKQASRELVPILSPLNPQPSQPSQLRYLQYISRRNIGSNWPPSERPLIIDCVILRVLPLFDGGKGCGPVVRVYGQDSSTKFSRRPKLLFSSLKSPKQARHYLETECTLKLDIRSHVQGDTVLECIYMYDDLLQEEIMFRIMFHTSFIRSNILTLSREEIDIPWGTKDRFPKDFKVEVVFSDIGAFPVIITERDSDDDKEMESVLPKEFFEVEENSSNVLYAPSGKTYIDTPGAHESYAPARRPDIKAQQGAESLPLPPPTPPPLPSFQPSVEMSLFRRFFYRKPPDRLLEISERVYVFDCCFSMTVLDEDDYKEYLGGIVAQLQDYYPDASFMLCNFREGDRRTQISDILSQYDMTVMEYPQQYENCSLLPLEMIYNFLRSSESWLSKEGQENVLLMHCDRGGWPVLAFMLAGLLLYRKQYNGEQKTLEMVYKQASRELLQNLSPLNPQPSQLRYLQYISRRNLGSNWPSSERSLIIDCVILRVLPLFDGGKGCRPVVRVYGKDPSTKSGRRPKLLFSSLKSKNQVRHYLETECTLVKLDIRSRVQGDIVLECIHLCDDHLQEEIMFRIMFYTSFIRSNTLTLSREEIDIPWDAKEQFPKDFKGEVLFSEVGAVPVITTVVDSNALDAQDGKTNIDTPLAHESSAPARRPDIKAQQEAGFLPLPPTPPLPNFHP